MAVNKEILQVVKSFSNERDLNEDVIVNAIESALATVTAKQKFPNKDVDVRVAFNKDTGEYDTYYRRTIVADVPGLPLEFPDRQITLSQAKEMDKDLQVGDVVEEQIDSVPFGRIAAQQARHVIMQRVREAERGKVSDLYRRRLGELMNGVVKKVTRDYLIMDCGDSVEAILPREEMIPREAFRMGDRVRAVLYDLREEKRGPQLLLSRTRPEMLVELFKIEVPEIGEEVIEIKAAVRDPGLRAKIAVKTNDGRIDPIGACVGMRGARVQAVSNELSGERVDIVLWDDNPAQLVINAMAPAEVVSIYMDEEAHAMDIAVPEGQLSQAIGRNGQNVRLASELTGWRLNVMSETAASEKQQKETSKVKSLFVEKLEVEEEVADLLAAEGFTTLEEVAYVPQAELAQIEGFDEEVAKELQSRAKDVLLTQALAEESKKQLSDTQDLFAVEGMTAALIEQLNQHGIHTRDDLAELAVDDLQDIIKEMDNDQAARLIMAARAHWFE